MDRTFPTFCHVSDYDLVGYRSLHRMIAASSPLVLWAPSGRVLDDYARANVTTVDAVTLVRLVNDGHVQLVGRRDWFLNKRQRKAHPWPGAHWYDAFDGPIAAICENDLCVADPRQRRVRIVQDADGYEFAQRVLGPDGEPVAAPAIYRRVLRLFRAGHVPSGTAQKAARAAGQARGARAKRRATAREILRDARNHMEAIRLSNAAVPFWSLEDGAFFALLEEEPRATAPERPGADAAEREALVAFWRYSLELLTRLERVAPSGETIARPDRLDRFLRSEAHAELCAWLGLQADNARFMRADAVPAYLLSVLRQDLPATRGKRDPAHVFSLPRDQLWRLHAELSQLVQLISTAADPGNVLGIVALTLWVIQIGQRLLVPPTYPGSHWPFFYAFGDSPSPERVARLREMVETMLRDAGETSTAHAVP